MRKWLARLAIMTGIFVAGLSVGRMASVPPGSADPSDVRRIMDHIRRDYVDDGVSPEELYYGSLKGLVEALNDPYSEFTTPAETSIQAQEFDGKFAGIGAQVGPKDDHTVIISPLPNSPAAKAGLLPGDIIVEVDGTSVDGKPLEEAVSRLRGKTGTPVTVTIYRKGEQNSRSVTITRDEFVHAAPLTWKVEAKGDTRLMILTLTSFNEEGLRLFIEAMQEAAAKKVNAVLLDLRGNPGGLLPVARGIACAWLPAGATVARLEPRGGGGDALTCPKSAGFLSSVRTAVLVNGGSASASEILAGALQDQGHARLIGEKTFGKGCGQNLYSLPDGSQLRLTTFLWKTPKGRTIHKLGITPDETLVLRHEDRAAGKDTQLDRAIQYLTTGR